MLNNEYDTTITFAKGQQKDRVTRVALAITLGLATVITVASTLWAAGPLWQPDGVPVSTAPGNQEQPYPIPDGMGGVIIAWQDGRADSGDVYVQRLNADGDTLWTSNGISLSTAEWGQDAPKAVSDGSGGAIVTWEDHRTDTGIYAQRVYSNGTAAWATDGVSLSTGLVRWYPQIASDGADGAIVVWQHWGLKDNWDIYAQRVYSNGATAWATDGISVCTVSGDQNSPQIISDGMGGAIVVWKQDDTNDLYAQRVNADGTLAWATDGVTVCAASGAQWEHQITSDGVGGAIIVWQDHRRGSMYNDVYAQRVYSDGTAAWATDGISICTASGERGSAQITSDGAGGVIVAWDDGRNGSPDIYAQRVYSNGTVAWVSDGISVCTAPDFQLWPQLVGDGAGGAVVAWQDLRNGDWDVYAQQVRADGTLALSSDGITLSTASGNQSNLGITGDGVGGAIVAWEDERGADIDVYAQRVKAAPVPGVEIGPNHSATIQPGMIVTYTHILTNTGDITSTIGVNVASSQGWTVKLLNSVYPTGTSHIPWQLGARMTATFQVRLTVPTDAVIGTVDYTVVTAALYANNAVQATATDTTTVGGKEFIYLPLVLR